MSANISIFVPHAGCPHKCSFCDQNSITDICVLPHAADVEKTAAQAISQLKDHKNAELAFFGGSFTAIEPSYRDELLDAAYPFVERGDFKGIRISTRPDYIDDEILTNLKVRGVTSIELGAQSMDDMVLAENMRGHSSADVERSSRLIRSYGFELGLQMMTGLYKSTAETDFSTAEKIAALSPDTVRIYPTITLPGTLLARLFERGEYIPPTLEDTVKLCSRLILFFNGKGIRIIKLGLHPSAEVSEKHIAGPFHPAFRELCEGEIYYNAARKAISDASASEKAHIVLYVANGCISKMTGQKRKNIDALKSEGFICRVKEDGTLKPFEVRAEAE